MKTKKPTDTELLDWMHENKLSLKLLDWNSESDEQEKWILHRGFGNAIGGVSPRDVLLKGYADHQEQIKEWNEQRKG